jgi:hypothetical protein
MFHLYEPDLSLGFLLTVLFTLFLFFHSFSATGHRTLLLIFSSIAVWMLLQALIAGTGFYRNFVSPFPRLFLAVIPALITVIYFGLFRNFLSYFHLRRLTLIHWVRIPVELLLLSLYYDKEIPIEMTFEGRNFDILAGLTAIIVSHRWFYGSRTGLTFLLVWNGLALALLFNIVLTAVLSLPAPFQVFGIAQPNVAVTYFPFIWLPSVVVPLVLLAHIISIRKIRQELKTHSSI